MADQDVKYAPGMRIIVRGEEWMVRKVETNTMGNQTLYVVGISKLVKDYESIFLDDIENGKIEVVDPANIKLVPDDSSFFRKSKVYIESQWRRKTPTDNKIHIGDKAAMDLMPYQLEPAQKALNNIRQRILIADNVGLGKTLEAGILMSELIARGKGRRILVVTVKSMMTQFQKEMWNRFSIPLVRLDSGKIQSIRAKLPSNANPFFYYDKAIISVDTLKNDISYRTHLESAWWDIIVIDEAHNVAKRGDRRSQRGNLAQLLAHKSDTLIMLSATPHDGRSQSFASLMNMLDPTAIADPENYTKEDVQGLYIRRFKKDIQDQIAATFKERVMNIERCDASAAEENAYSIFADMSLEMDKNKTRGTGQLFKTGLEKSLFSSPAACIKTVEERLKKLRKKYADNEIKDIEQLEALKSALEQITPNDFSRYQRLLSLLKSSEYDWHPEKNNDRLVIFTERIETMKYLAEHLKRDLDINENAIQTMYGGMSDKELQQIVDEFGGRAESPLRVLIASDVASEGINLHYYAHRLIHFDIPWSLMVFQQRNGRIDRYGQHETPDIRYMLIGSKNDEIKGDARIMEILVQKEEQAYKNIGDPAVLFGKFNEEDEIAETAAAIENNENPDDFAARLDKTAEEFDPFAGWDDEVQEEQVEYSDDTTLYSDMDYIESAFSLFTDKERLHMEKMSSVEGIEITLNDDMKRAMRRVVPEDAMPSDDILRLSPDKDFCMKEMKRCMTNSLAESAWPATEFLWKLHPIFNWIDDKAGIIYKRTEAPFLGIPELLHTDEFIYVVTGSYSNRKSSPVVDEWFGLYFEGDDFHSVLDMNEVIAKTGIKKNDIPNRQEISADQVLQAEELLPKAVEEAKKFMNEKRTEYKTKTDPYIYEETGRLLALQDKHKEYVQLSFADMLPGSGFERRKSEKEREIDEMFNNFSDWEKDTLEIEDKPYIRIVAAITGVI